MRQLCTFYLGTLVFGIDVAQVREVVQYQRVAPVPLAPSLIRGMINLRGEIILVLDLRRRLGLEVIEPTEDSYLVVAAGDGGALSLLVDNVGEVLEVERSQIERPPSTLESPMSDLVEAVCKLDGQLLLILDSENPQLLPTLETLRGATRPAEREEGALHD